MQTSGVDVNLKDGDGVTAVRYAVKRNDSAMVNSLLKACAIVNAVIVYDFSACL